MHKRTKTTLLIVIVILAALGVAIYLRKQAPPEAARLLPESDGIVYINLRPLRAVTHFDKQAFPHDPDYQHFLDATGFQFERDLDEAAFALHRMPDPHGPNGPAAFSEVFVGRFDGKRLQTFLESQATARESYAGHTIYSIPNEGRTVRIALVGYDIVAVSNTPTSEQIHSILDRYRSAALPFSGCSLLSEHYHEIPLLSLAWGIGKIGLPLGEDNQTMSIMGLRMPFPADSTFLASIRWAGSLKLRLEQIAPSEEAAAAAAQNLQTLLVLFRGAADVMVDRERADGKDFKTVIDSANIDHKKNRTILTASVPLGLLEKLVSLPAPSTPAPNLHPTEK
jgi:hypothetical protein